jgi:hypothetical protein
MKCSTRTGWEVPALPLACAQRPYYVIVRATATTPSGTTVRDSIPMRGTVTTGPECLTATQSGVMPPGHVTFP